MDIIYIDENGQPTTIPPELRKKIEAIDLQVKMLSMGVRALWRMIQSLSSQQ